MRIKILFWLAVVVAAVGTHSPDGRLFYFFAVHLAMLMIGFFFYQREKRGRTAVVKALTVKPPAGSGKAKPQ